MHNLSREEKLKLMELAVNDERIQKDMNEVVEDFKHIDYEPW